jgi:hypothetical protein
MLFLLQVLFVLRMYCDIDVDFGGSLDRVQHFMWKKLLVVEYFVLILIWNAGGESFVD